MGSQRPELQRGAPVIQHFLVVYLDVLGQRDELRRLTTLPQNDAELRQASAALKRTLGCVLQLRELFKTLFDSYSKPADFLKSLPEPEQEALRGLRRSEVLFYGFSDSFVVSVPLRSHDDHCTPINGVHAALLASAIMPLNSLGLGHALRGGIDVGVGAQLDSGEVYGAALERAYTLEHDVSDYPRITVGDELISYLQFVRDQPTSSIPATCAKRTAERCLRFLARDSDGKVILDYLGEAVREIGANAVRPETLTQVYEFASRELVRFTLKGDTKLTSRYKRLNEYLAGRKALWEPAGRRGHAGPS
ncbi:MAG: hypothetical protein ABSA52_00935 [Candidatus Binatia bacterium]|jgi:hypothetical protein